MKEIFKNFLVLFVYIRYSFYICHVNLNETNMKTHLEETVKKYSAAYAEMVKRIKSESFEVIPFITEMGLPGNFVISCTKLGLVTKISRTKFVVKVEAKSELIGKMIADQICKIEKFRKIRSNQLNS